MYNYEQANPFWRLVRKSGEWRPMSWLYARTLHHLDRAVYRATRGRATCVSWITGLPIVLLTTTGARSGRRRTLPLVAVLSEERLIVIASNYGQPHNPAWYHNLKANPSVTATLDGVTRVMTARELDGEQRDYWFERGIESYPGWATYRKRTAPHRRIPVMELTPTAESSR